MLLPQGKMPFFSTEIDGFGAPQIALKKHQKASKSPRKRGGTRNLLLPQGKMPFSSPEINGFGGFKKPQKASNSTRKRGGPGICCSRKEKCRFLVLKSTVLAVQNPVNTENETDRSQNLGRPGGGPGTMSWGRAGASGGAPRQLSRGCPGGVPGLCPRGPRDAPGRPRTACPGGAPGQPVPAGPRDSPY